MYIKLSDLYSKYNLKINGIIHIGSHLLEELYSHLTSYNKPEIAKKSPSTLKYLSKSKGVKPAFLILKTASWNLQNLPILKLMIRATTLK